LFSDLSGGKVVAANETVSQSETGRPKVAYQFCELAPKTVLKVAMALAARAW
jgi:hypothetical protein